MTGYGGFPWPWRGPVSAPEVWNPAWGDQPDDWVGGFRRSAKRGGGLHGFENGEGEWGLLSWDTQAKALIIETDESRIVRDKRTDASRRRILAGASGAPAAPGDGGPVRFSSGDVVDVTSLPAALCRLVCNPERVLAGILALTATDENCSGKRIAATMRTALASTDRDETLAATASLCQLASAGQRSRLFASAVNTQLASAGRQSVLASTAERCQLAASGERTLITAAGRRSKVAASGDHAQIAASGDQGSLASAGDFSRAVTSGTGCHLAASGVHNMLAASGSGASLAGAGPYPHLAASGEGSRLTTSGHEATLDAVGKDSICMAAGTNSRAKAGPGGAIAIAWHDGTRPRIAIGYVGESGIKADTWYKVQDGVLTEQEEWSPYDVEH